MGFAAAGDPRLGSRVTALVGEGIHEEIARLAQHAAARVRGRRRSGGITYRRRAGVARLRRASRSPRTWLTAGEGPRESGDDDDDYSDQIEGSARGQAGRAAVRHRLRAAPPTRTRTARCRRLYELKAGRNRPERARRTRLRLPARSASRAQRAPWRAMRGLLPGPVDAHPRGIPPAAFAG